MESSSSFASTIVSFLCLAGMCLVPLAAIGGGIFFFVNRNKKKQAASSLTPATPYAPPVVPAPVPQVPVVPVAPVSPVQQQPRQQQPMQQQPMQPQQPVAVPVPQPVVQPTVSPAPLTMPRALNVSPSELVVLRGEAFSPAGGKFNWYQLPGSEQKVDLPTLVNGMFAAAFLALREAGALRLEAGKRKVTLGLREIDTIFAVPTGATTNWPAGSYEAQFLALANEMAVKNNHNVNAMVFRVLGRNSQNPESVAANNACQALKQRGILGTTEQKGFLGIKTYQYALPAETQAALAQTQADVTAVQGLLGRAQQSEPGLWQLLDHEIKEALKARTETDSGPDIND